MARPEFARARAAYQLAHARTASRGLVIALVLAALAYGLHRTTDATWLVAGALASTLVWLGWRGGSARRGALAGVIAGLPPMLVPGVVALVSNGGRCAQCAMAPSFGCMMTCFATSAIVGLAVGHHASRDLAPGRFAAAAAVTATLTGALGCGTTGLGGTLGIVVGLIAGGLTGWVTAERAVG
jgi:hypothetical protein